MLLNDQIEIYFKILTSERKFRIIDSNIKINFKYCGYGYYYDIYNWGLFQVILYIIRIIDVIIFY